jgi:hypothetical protein
VVRLVFKVREQGFSCDTIANYLNDKGYRTNRGSMFRYGMISRILRHEAFYRGETTIAKKIKAEQVAHEPILPPREPGMQDLYQRVPEVSVRNRVYDDNGGYQKRSPHFGRHFVNADILEAARLTFEMRAEGKTMKETRDKLNSLELKPPIQQAHTTDTVRVILKNEHVWRELFEQNGIHLDESVWSYRRPLRAKEVSLTAFEIAMVKKARELYEPRQLTLDQIAAKLNGLGFTNSKGGPLTKVQVHRMLKGQERYCRLPKELVATESELASSPQEAELVKIKEAMDKRMSRPPKAARYDHKRSAA